MNRRIFLKLAGMSPLLTLAKEQKYTIGADMASGKDRTVLHYQKKLEGARPLAATEHRVFNEQGYFDFSPDSIFDVRPWEDKMLVYCKHSIWIIRKNSQGGIERALWRYW